MSSSMEEVVEGHLNIKFKVLVTYNGVNKHIEVQSNELVRALLDRAVHAFGPIPNPHLLGLFTQDGRELQDNKTLKEEGVRPDDHLLLRPSAVRGG
jgi:hypothetical protein